jgi:hypothetical protein
MAFTETDTVPSATEAVTASICDNVAKAGSRGGFAFHGQGCGPAAKAGVASKRAMTASLALKRYIQASGGILSMKQSFGGKSCKTESSFLAKAKDTPFLCRGQLDRPEANSVFGPTLAAEVLSLR